jgi:hypothetical protein
MKPFRPISPDPKAHDDSTGLPGLVRWRSVYSVVLGIFVLFVVLLHWLTRTFS